MTKFEFKDKLGTVWDTSIDLAAAKVIDASDYSQVTELEFTFLAPDRQFFSELFVNKPLVAAIVYTIVSQDQLDKLGDDKTDNDEINQIKFLKRLNGPALRDMHRAVLEAVADFFPEMQTVLSKLLKQMDKVNSRLQQEADQMDKQMESFVNKEMDKAIAEAKARMQKVLSGQPGETSSSL